MKSIQGWFSAALETKSAPCPPPSPANWRALSQGDTSWWDKYLTCNSHCIDGRFILFMTHPTLALVLCGKLQSNVDFKNGICKIRSILVQVMLYPRDKDEGGKCDIDVTWLPRCCTNIYTVADQHHYEHLRIYTLVAPLFHVQLCQWLLSP